MIAPSEKGYFAKIQRQKAARQAVEECTIERALDTPLCYGYARVSTDRQAQTGMGLDGQDQAIEAHYQRIVASRGVPLVDIRVEAISASKVPFANRDHGAQLMELLGVGDHIIFSKVDRAFRDVIDCLSTIRDLIDSGVVVHIADIQFDSSNHAKLKNDMLMLQMKAAFAEHESRTLGERVKEVNAIRRQQGYAICGKVPLGYKLTGPKGRRRVVPDEAMRKTMRKFRELAEGGMTFYAIERYLVEHRVMRRVRDRSAKDGWRLEFWRRDEISRAVRLLNELEKVEAAQAARLATSSNAHLQESGADPVSNGDLGDSLLSG